MAPFYEAIEVEEVSSLDGVTIYKGTMDRDWLVGSVPNGGYSLGIILNACRKLQANTTCRDPLHITAHYLQATQVAPCEVHVRVLKSGRNYTNLLADLKQNGTTRITTHHIFGTISPPPPTTGRHQVIQPPSPFARRIPLTQYPPHPEETPPAPRDKYTFSKRTAFAVDEEINARKDPTHPARRDGDGGIEWASWVELTGKEDKLTPSALCLLGDVAINMPSLLPKGDPMAARRHWFPTLTLSIEFKFPIPPSTSPFYADRTVGVWSKGTWLNDPQGRHDCHVEVWTAPVNLTDDPNGKKNEGGWRDQMRCLAIVDQMAICVPFEMNTPRIKDKGVEKATKGAKL